jgi:hypothetical protein
MGGGGHIMRTTLNLILASFSSYLLEAVRLMLELKARVAALAPEGMLFLNTTSGGH